MNRRMIRCIAWAGCALCCTVLMACRSTAPAVSDTTAQGDPFDPAPAQSQTLPQTTARKPVSAAPVTEEIPVSDLSLFNGQFGVSSGGRLMTFASDGVTATLRYRTETGVATVSGILSATDRTLSVGDTAYPYAFWNGMLLITLEDQPYILQKDDPVADPLLSLLSGSYAGDGLAISGADGQLSLSLEGYTLSAIPAIESVGKVTLIDPASRNLALSATGKASSVETGGREEGAAIDGDLGTRWSSEYKDGQWLILDLGAVETVGTLRLYWETAAGRNYDLLLSEDGENWTTVAVVTDNTDANCWLTYTVETQSARYVKLDGHTRVGEYGFSLYEIEVYHRYAPAQTFTCIAEEGGIALTMNGTTYHLKEVG